MGLCESGDCPDVVYSSDIVFDGSFANITVPAGLSLDEVMVLMETYFNNTLLDLEDVTYTLADGTCLGLAAGDYNYQQIVTAIITKLCELVNATTNPTDTDNVDLVNIVLPECFGAFTGTTSTSLFNIILEALCVMDTGVILPSEPVGGSTVSGSSVNVSMLKDYTLGLVDNDTYVYEHTTVVTSPTLLNVTVKPMKAIIGGWFVKITTDEVFALTPNKDIYFTLSDKSTISKIEKTIGDPAPSMTGKAFLYKIVTDGSGVVSYSEEFETSPFNAPALAIPNNYIQTVMIDDAVVTPAKLTDTVAAATKGHSSLIEIVYNAKGQITAVNSDLGLAGLADGQILKYDAGTGGFINDNNLSVGTNGFIPLASAGDFTASAIEEDVNQIKASKKIEINTGVAVDDANAGLNIVTGTFILPRYTAAAASALVGVADGTTIYVSTTDATFLTVGVWCMIATVWTKLHT